MLARHCGVLVSWSSKPVCSVVACCVLGDIILLLHSIVPEGIDRNTPPFLVVSPSTRPSSSRLARRRSGLLAAAVVKLYRARGEGGGSTHRCKARTSVVPYRLQHNRLGHEGRHFPEHLRRRNTEHCHCPPPPPTTLGYWRNLEIRSACLPSALPGSYPPPPPCTVRVASKYSAAGPEPLPAPQRAKSTASRCGTPRVGGVFPHPAPPSGPHGRDCSAPLRGGGEGGGQRGRSRGAVALDLSWVYKETVGVLFYVRPVIEILVEEPLPPASPSPPIPRGMCRIICAQIFCARESTPTRGI